MDYGEIFVGTFRTIWHNKRLWLFAILAQIVPALAAILAAVFGLRFLQNLAQVINSTARGGGPLPPNLGMQIGASWLGFVCLASLLALAGYIVHLIMRSAIINEASIAWAGALTDWRRGLRAGTARAPYVFLIDLLWWVPLAFIIAVVYGGGFGLWVAGIASLANSSQANQGGLIALTICCLLCFGILFGVLVALFRGIFAPLMYQSAVQGRRTAGQAAVEGWGLARAHFGPMFIFLLLVFVVYAAAYVLMQVIGYPLRIGWMSGSMDWISRLSQGIPRGGGPVPSVLPEFNTPLVIAGTIVLAMIGLLVNSFVDTFGLTMYAAVYRRLTGRHLVLTDRDLEPPSTPSVSPAPREEVGPTGESYYTEAPAEDRPVVPDVEPPANEPGPNA